MYLVRTPDMDKAEKDGGKFEGIVAELVVVRTPGSEEPKIGYSLANAPAKDLSHPLGRQLGCAHLLGAAQSFCSGFRQLPVVRCFFRYLVRPQSMSRVSGGTAR